MTERVTVEFEVNNREDFERQLQVWDSTAPNSCSGYRIDEGISKRESLRKFVNDMELKLRKNDHKSDWRDKPIEALFKLLLVEIEEFKVMYEYFPVTEARRELIDVANFALIVWDRLGMLHQGVPASWVGHREMNNGQPVSARTPDRQYHSEMVSSMDPQQRHSK